jgi:hypothetical protein
MQQSTGPASMGPAFLPAGASFQSWPVVPTCLYAPNGSLNMEAVLSLSSLPLP